MKVFITGSPRGQLHHELLQTAPDGIEWLQPTKRLDITDAAAVIAEIESRRPEVILNAAAYTAVDKAESEPQAARAVNATAVATLADAAGRVGAHLVHVSTDFVFGPGNGAPFPVQAAVAPVSVYGQTKLEGEQDLQARLPDDSVCIRTAWVYSSHGNNFVKTMLRLMNERGEVGVIADQIGSPTWARSLAQAVWRSAERRLSGMLHWTGAGACSWYDFAVAIEEEGRLLGLIERPVTIRPLTTEQYPTPAARPHYSVLDLHPSWQALDLTADHWRSDLRQMLRELT